MADIRNITDLTEAAYDRERERIRSTYGDSKRAAGARFEQELAALFYRSGRTQQWLADKEGKSQTVIAHILLFGRFLAFIAAAINSEKLPHNLNVWRFRQYWNRTSKSDNERARFREVERLMAEDLALVTPRGKNLAGEIRTRFGDGKWHLLSDICAAFPDIAPATVETALKRQIHDKRRHGAEFDYRIFIKDKPVHLSEITEKLAPIIAGLREQGRKNAATVSIPTVATFAGRLQKLLDEWSED